MLTVPIGQKTAQMVVVVPVGLEVSPGVAQPVPWGWQSWMIPPSTGCEHGGYWDGREGQAPTRVHHCMNRHRKINTCFKKCNYSAKGGVPNQLQCSSPLPIPHSHPSLPKKSFTVIYLYCYCYYLYSLLRVLAEVWWRKHEGCKG